MKAGTASIFGRVQSFVRLGLVGLILMACSSAVLAGNIYAPKRVYHLQCGSTPSETYSSFSAAAFAGWGRWKVPDFWPYTNKVDWHVDPQCSSQQEPSLDYPHDSFGVDLWTTVISTGCVGNTCGVSGCAGIACSVSGVKLCSPGGGVYSEGSVCKCPGTSQYIDEKKTCANPHATTAPDNPSKSNGRSCPHCGDPINPANGNSWQIEKDYAAATTGGLTVARFYNSNPNSASRMGVSPFGDHWTHRYDVRLALQKEAHTPDSPAQDCWQSVDTGGEIFCLSGERTSFDVPPAISTVSISRPDGKLILFSAIGGNWIPDSDINDRLTATSDGNGNYTDWYYVASPGDETEHYNANGMLLSITSRSGAVQRMTYANGATNDTSAGRLPADAPVCPNVPAGDPKGSWTLLCVTDNWGHQIQYDYNALDTISKVIDPAGQIYLYTYNGATSGCTIDVTSNPACLARNLTQVTYPDGKNRTYYYNEAAQINDGAVCSGTNTVGNGFAHLINQLTGVIDENGVRYASWTYDCNGLATSSVLAGGANRTDVIHNITGNGTTTMVKYYLGDPAAPYSAGRFYTFQQILGVLKNTGIDDACPECGSVAARTYDAFGNATDTTDWNGNHTTYVLDTTRNLETSRTEAFGTPQARTITTQWHPIYRLVTAMAEPKRITTFVYDTSGNMTSKTVKATGDATGAQAFSAAQVGTSRTWQFTYNTVGQILTVTGPRTDVADVTTYTYDTSGNLATVQNAAGQVTTLSNYDANGRAGTITSPNGTATNLNYSPRGWLLSRSVSYGGVTENTGYDYDGAGQMIRVTMPDNSILTYTYDGAHRLTDIADSFSNTIHYTLDMIGNRTKEQVIDPNGVLALQTSRSYDRINNLVKVIGGSQNTTLYDYDNNSNLTQVTDPLGRITNQSYDALNRVIQQLQPAPTSSSGRPAIGYTYDGLDQVATVTDPRSLTTAYTTDGLGNQSTLVSPDTGTTSKTFDANGNAKTSTDAKGQVTTYSYDALNRVTQISYSSGTPSQFEYDGGSAGGANNIGRLTKMTDESGQTIYVYDGIGHLIQKVQTIGSGTSAKVFTTGYAYGTMGTATGKLTSMTYPSGTRVNYLYDTAGRISSLILNPANTSGGGTNTAVTTNLITGIGYSPFGAVQSWTWGNSTSTNVNTYARGFDLDGRITDYPLGNALSNGLTRSLTYDNASRINAINHTGTGTGTNAPANYDQSLGYDNLDRLTNFGRTNTSNNFNYDATGNRTSVDFGSGISTNTIAAGSNQLASITSSTGATTSRIYDTDGNLTNDGIRNVYTYNAQGRMQGVNPGGRPYSFTFTYNGVGQRMTKGGPGGVYALYQYDEHGHILGEYDNSNNVLQETIYLGDLPVALVPGRTGGDAYSGTVNTSPFYIYADQINTPRVITRSSDNQIVWRWDYTDPFGMQSPNGNPSNLGNFTYNPRFPGQLYDTETNLYFNGYRNYDQQTGRYVESDPIGLAAGPNTYAYVGGNPLSYIDPEGLMGGGGNHAPPPISPATKKLICKYIRECKGKPQCAFTNENADRKRKSPSGVGRPNWYKSDYREAENFLYSAGWPDAIGGTSIGVAIWQLHKLVPGTDTSPFSSDAWDAGLAGIRHQNKSPEDWMKWCDDCAK